jgi:hypothetical protein
MPDTTRSVAPDARALPGAKIAALVALGLLAYTGFACGLTAMNAVFLSLAGAQSLAYVYLLTPVLMGVAVVFFTWVLERRNALGQLQAALALNAAVGLLLWLLYRPPDQSAPLYQHVAGLLLVNMWLYSLYSAFWNFADSLFSTREARTSYSYLAAAISGGFVIGGALCTQLGNHLATPQLFMIWSVAALLSLPLSEFIARRYPAHVRPAELSDGASLGRRLGRVGRSLRQSPYACALAAQFFLVIVLALLSEYLYLSTFERHARQAGGLPAEQQLTSLLGTLTALANLANLGITLIVLPRLVQKLGVRGVVFILPAAYLVLFVFISIQMNLPLAIAAFFVYQSLQMAIDQNNQNLLVRALPSGVGRELRTAIEGASEPLAVALVGLFLLPEMSAVIPWAGAASLQPADIGLAGLAVAGLALIAAMLVRRFYYPSLRANIGQGLRSGAASRRTTAPSPSAAHRACTQLESTLAHSPAQASAILLALDPSVLDKVCLRRLLATASQLDTRSLRALRHLVAGAGLSAVPVMVTALREPASGYHARSIAATALSQRASRVFLDLLPELESAMLAEAEACVAAEAAAPNTAATCLWIRWLRQRSSDAVDLLLGTVALAGRIPDASVVRRLLQSPSAFDRGEALDVLEQGFPHRVFARLHSVLELQMLTSAVRWDATDLGPAAEQVTTADTHTREPVGVVATLDLLGAVSRERQIAAGDAILRSDSTACAKQIVLRMVYGTSDAPDPAHALRRLLADARLALLPLRALYLASQTDATRSQLLTKARMHTCLARSLFYQWAH